MLLRALPYSSLFLWLVGKTPSPWTIIYSQESQLLYHRLEDVNNNEIVIFSDSNCAARTKQASNKLYCQFRFLNPYGEAAATMGCICDCACTADKARMKFVLYIWTILIV